MILNVMNRDEVVKQAVAMTGEALSTFHVEQWMREHGYKRLVTAAKGDACEDLYGAVWIHEAKYKDLFDPMQMVQQPIDRERITTLSNLWDHKQSKSEQLI